MAAGTALLLAGCGATQHPDLPSGAAMPESYPAPNLEQALSQLRLKAYDQIDVQVYQEPELSVRGVMINAGGNILLPMAGEIHAAGMSPKELADEIARQLRAAYLVNPQVSVQQTGGMLNRVTVTGAVLRTGVYDVKGPITLIDALALAGGISNVARRKDVAIIRKIDGKRAGAIFDIGAIERGEADDPAVLPEDKIVVGTSAIRQGYRDLLQATPILGIGFRAFGVY